MTITRRTPFSSFKVLLNTRAALGPSRSIPSLTGSTVSIEPRSKLSAPNDAQTSPQRAVSTPSCAHDPKESPPWSLPTRCRNPGVRPAGPAPKPPNLKAASLRTFRKTIRQSLTSDGTDGSLLLTVLADTKALLEVATESPSLSPLRDDADVLNPAVVCAVPRPRSRRCLRRGGGKRSSPQVSPIFS